jgi:hypothetical protein
MVIHDLDFCWPAFCPGEANPPLVVDTNAVLPGAVALQQFKAVARRGSKVAQDFRIVQLSQLALCSALDIRSNPSGEAAMEQGLGVPIGE